MRIVVISGSLRPQSLSRVLAHRALNTLQERGVDTEWVDLRQVDLPMCEGTEASKGGDVGRLTEAFTAADGLLVAAPISNFDVNGAVKNLVDQLGRQAWTDKTVGFLCAAGGHSSYMSIMSLANSLMLNHRCVIVPRFVYATSDDFDDDGTDGMTIASDEVAERVDQLAAEVVRLAGAA